MEGSRSLPGKQAPVNIPDYHLEPLEACALGAGNEVNIDGAMLKSKKKHNLNKKQSKNQNQTQLQHRFWNYQIESLKSLIRMLKKNGKSNQHPGTDG